MLTFVEKDVLELHGLLKDASTMASVSTASYIMPAKFQGSSNSGHNNRPVQHNSHAYQLASHYSSANVFMGPGKRCLPRHLKGHLSRNINIIECSHPLYPSFVWQQKKGGGIFSALNLAQAEGDRKGHHSSAR